MITVGALTYDAERQRLYKYGRAISLGPSCLRLLVYLMEHPERAFGIDDLISRLWGGEVLSDAKARKVIHQQVKRIRLAIEDDTGPWLVCERQWGYGLWIEPPVARALQVVTAQA